MLPTTYYGNQKQPLTSILPCSFWVCVAFKAIVQLQLWLQVQKGQLSSYFFHVEVQHKMIEYDSALRIQVCPKEGITPRILFWGWDWNPQSYSWEGSGFLGQHDSTKYYSADDPVIFGTYSICNLLYVKL